MIAVVTDSTCDLHPTLARQLGLEVVPLHVLLGERRFRDWHEIELDAVFDHVRGGGSVTTQPVAQAAFEQLYRELLATHDSVVSLHLSGHLSATVDHARHAAQALKAGGHVHVIDSGLTSLALAEAAIVAREAAAAGADLPGVLRAIETAQDGMLTEFTIPDLEYLRRGGRLSRAQQLLGSVLGMQPVMRFDEGRFRAVRRVRSPHVARDILGQLEAHFGRDPVSVSIAHAGRDPVRIAELKAAMNASSLKVVRGRLQLLGPVIGAHVGPGAYGLLARRVEA